MTAALGLLYITGAASIAALVYFIGGLEYTIAYVISKIILGISLAWLAE